MSDMHPIAVRACVCKVIYSDILSSFLENPMHQSSVIVVSPA